MLTEQTLGKISVMKLSGTGEAFLTFSPQRRTGPGIPIEDDPHVSDRFWQPRNTARMGTGLGLSIARAIVEGHSGTIGVQSASGEGSCFHFSLPSVRAGAADAGPSWVRSPHGLPAGPEAPAQATSPASIAAVTRAGKMREARAEADRRGYDDLSAWIFQSGF